MKHDKTETVAKCRVLAFKRWLFTMRNIESFTLHFVTFWNSVGLWLNLGLFL